MERDFLKEDVVATIDEFRKRQNSVQFNEATKNLDMDVLTDLIRRNAKDTKIRKGIYDFYYLDYKFDLSEERDNLMQTLSSDIMDLYMTTTYVIEANDSDYTVDSDNLKADYAVMLNREIDKKLNHIIKPNVGTVNIGLKIVSENINTYLYMNTHEIDENRTEMLMFKFDSSKKILSIYMWTFDPSNGVELLIQSHALSPMFYSSKERKVTDLVGSHPGMFTAADSIRTASFINVVLEKYISETNCGLEVERLEVTQYSHSPFELSVFNRIKNHILAKSKIYMYMVTSWMNSEYHSNSIRTKIGVIDRMDIVSKFITPKYDVPLVDFNEKEMKFTLKYVNSLKPFGGEKDVDLVDVFENPKYGKELIFPVRNDDTECHINTMYDYSRKEDDLKFMMLITSERYLKIYAEVKFRNISNFNFHDDTIMFQGCIVFEDTETRFPSSMEEFKEMIPTEILRYDNFLPMVLGFLAVYVIIHLRPERSRVIRETTKITPAYDSIASTNIKKQRRHETPKEQFLVRRILKDVKAAKEYIAKVASEESSNREYTIENWERVGHWRRKPHSDEKIWIKPTRCHRHLELSDKEVHLKL